MLDDQQKQGNRPTKKEIEAADNKPSSLRLKANSIPQELKARQHFVLWGHRRVKEKWTKLPYQPGGTEAASDNPATWSSFDKVLASGKRCRGQYDGVGFVFSEDDPYCGIDLDDAIDAETGKLKPWAEEIVDQLNSYTETSPSGTGVKVWVKGKKKGDRCAKRHEDGKVELYDSLRYFAMTGHHWPGTPETIEERQEQVDALYQQLFGEEKRPPQTSPAFHSNGTGFLADDELIAKAGTAANGDKFRRLFNGDVSEYNDDDSAADQALANILIWWTNHDCAQADRIFRRSGLMRGKWDERRGQQTYGEMTIAEADRYVQGGYRDGSQPVFRNGASTNGDRRSVPTKLPPDREKQQAEQQEKASEALAGLLNKLKENVGQTIEDALQAEALRSLGLLALDDAGRIELFYREVAKAGGKARDLDSLRRAVNQSRKQIKQDRIEEAQQIRHCIPRNFRILTNYDEQTVKTPQGTQTIRTGRNLNMIALDLLGLTAKWPKRRGQMLFATSENAPLWLDSPAALFAWAHGFVGTDKGSGVFWSEGDNMPSRSEFHAYLTQTVENYRAVEAFPHHPPMPEHFYVHPPIEGGDGEALRWLIHQFSPATLIDHDLIEALFLSMLWGGEPGSRPAWLITSDEDEGPAASGKNGAGRGVGKSFLAMLAAELVGGYLDVDANEKMSDIKKRLLSPEGQLKRVLLLDNLKTLKFSWSQLEALITATTISGHQMYEGEGSRPNTLTVIITLNGASLSKDMAQRCNILKLKRPRYDAKWEETTRQFIVDHRWAIIGDCLAKLQEPGKSLEQSDRWASWGRDVLSRVSEPADCAKVLQERRGDVDEDATECDMVRDYFAERLEEREHVPEQQTIFIPSDVVAEWVNKATGEWRAKPKACSYLSQLNVRGLRRAKHGGRGFLWTGTNAAEGQKPVDLNPDPWRSATEEREMDRIRREFG